MFQSSLKYIIVIVVMLGLWTVGFLDLAAHVSEDGRVLGRYSPQYFGLLLLYASVFLFWIGLLVWPESRIWVKRLINSIQSRFWLALIILTSGVMIAVNIPRIRLFTGNGIFMSSMLALLAFMGLVLLFAGWGTGSPVQFWRKVVAVLLALLVALELGAQVMAAAGMLPGKQDIAGLFVPYGRVYYTEEGFGRGLANNFGWYYPDFRLEDDSRRILIIGDSFIQALQIDRQQHVGVKLERLLNQAGEGVETEVIALGMPGFGPGLYVSLTRLDHAIQVFEPDEIIVFFNLGSDFQTATEPSGYDLYFELKEDNAVIHDESFNYQHDLKHLILDGYEPEFNPARTLFSHYLTPKLVGQWLNGKAREFETSGTTGAYDVPGFTGVVLNTITLDETHNKITAIDLMKSAGKNNFVFDKESGQKAADAFLIAQSLLEQSGDFAEARGVTFRVVTIPAFPKAFFAQPPADDWQTEIGNYDLFLPENVLQAFAEAEEIPFLAMGQYMKETGLSLDQIKNLYFSEGQGHFTPEGHNYFAKAIYSCFFAGDRQVKEVSCSVDRD